MKHTHQICLLLASTREGLANADTWKVLTKIQVSKSILQLAATNCVYMVYGAFQSKIGYALLMRTIQPTRLTFFIFKWKAYTTTTTTIRSYLGIPSCLLIGQMEWSKWPRYTAWV